VTGRRSTVEGEATGGAPARGQARGGSSNFAGASAAD